MPSRTSDDPLASRRQVIAILAAGAAMIRAGNAAAAPNTEIVHNMDAIHQEVAFEAPRSSVYAVLTQAQEFQKVIALSGAVASGKVQPSVAALKPASRPGRHFRFRGLCQSAYYRAGAEPAPLQAGVRRTGRPVFTPLLNRAVEQGAGTLLMFDQTGFPASDAEQLAQGWKLNYWQPMAKVLARQ